jgi:plastocyanin
MNKLVAAISIVVAPLPGWGVTGAPPSTAGGHESATPSPAARASGTGTASISGRISYVGPEPEPETLRMTADPRCKELNPDGLERRYIDLAEGGGVGGVVAYVTSGASGSYPAPGAPVVLDQRGCTYLPSTVALQVGQDLTIRNSDPTLHNIHPRPRKNQEFNVGQPRQGMETTRRFDRAELLIPVGCDVHPWMRAYISVFAHPFYAVTGADGMYTITNLPAGEYEIEAVHPSLGSVSRTLTVSDGEAAPLDLVFGGGDSAEVAAEHEDELAPSRAGLQRSPRALARRWGRLWSHPGDPASAS